MDAIIFSDMHFYNNPSKSYMTETGEYSWLLNQLITCDGIFSKAKEMGVTTVIHNGDLFHEKTRINIALYNTVWQFFKNKAKEGFQIILNTGNHDLLTYNDSALKPFSEMCEVITEPTLMNFGDTNFRFVPYGQEADALELPKGKGMFNVLFTHTDIAGLKYGPTDYESGAPLKYQLLSDWDIVFNGHIHKPQELKNIVSIGSPMVQDWGEVDEQKRLIQFKDNNYRSIALGGPKFVTLDRLTDKLKAKIATNTVDFFRIDVSSEQLTDPIFHQYNVFPRVVETKKREIRLRETETVEEEVCKYVEIIETKLDKKMLLKIGLELYHGID